MNWCDIESQFSYSNRYNNIFQACNVISKSARNLCISNLQCLSEAEALSWIISGVAPKKLKKYLEYKKSTVSRSFAHVLDSLCYIDDKEICDAVLASLEASMESNYLIYEYRNIKNMYKQSRVRIICNMLWYDVQIINNEDNIL